MLMPPAEVAGASALDDLQDPHARVRRGCARSRAGLVSAALADLDAVHAEVWAELEDLSRAALLTTAIDCRLARGELTRALEHGRDLANLLDHPGPTGATAHYGSGELAAATGDVEEAAAHFAWTGRLLADDLDDPDLLPWRAGAALAAVRAGRRTEGAALAREQVALARAAGATFGLAVGLRTLATVDAGADGAALLREAQAAVADHRAARLAAQVDTDLAGRLVLSARPGDQEEAHRLLRSAEQYAGREQLWPLQGRVRRLLDRMGEPARPVLGEALAALTASERRVARLAADGLTNREIAERLVVTIKAVEWHLSHVYRKLGIRSRSGLAASLGGNGRPSPGSART
jgi:DNA-binding NarL/FixJ family response regulator